MLLLVIVTAGVGLGVGQWRRAYPELAERLESFDRSVPPAELATADPAPAMPPSRTAPTPPRAEPALRRAAALKSEAPAQPVDINRASQDELRMLPGVGAVLAARIIEARERDGPFASLDDLRRVRGMGRAKLERLASAIALSP